MASAVQTFTKIGKVIRLNRHGCTNRPFYHIVVQKVKNCDNFYMPRIQSCVVVLYEKKIEIYVVFVLNRVFWFAFSFVFRQRILKMGQ